MKRDLPCQIVRAYGESWCDDRVRDLQPAEPLKEDNPK